MPFPEIEAEVVTAERMADPHVGDRFHEMYTYWVEVVYRDHDWIVGCEREGRLTLYTPDEFRQRHAYGSIPGYWVRYYDNQAGTGCVPVKGRERAAWLAAFVEERRLKLAEPSLSSAML